MSIEEVDTPSESFAASPHDTVFFGHPRGLAYLAFTEAWERFSYYGMQSLLVLYMVGQLLLPGHVEHVAAFGRFRAALESAYGPLSTQALASAIFGLYTSLVYLTPIAGGLIADRLLGRTRTVVLGALLMATGHFLMAFDVSFLAALLCLVCGVGCFKGNLASQVGGLYSETDNRRADAFQIYYIAINAGVISAPLVCGTLGEKVGWHWGFGAAGVGMLLGLAIYLSGRRWLPADAAIAKGEAKAPRAPIGGREGRVLIVLACLIPVLAIASLGNQQIFNAYLVWGQANFDFNFAGFVVPTTWLVTLDSIVSVSFLFLAVAFWRWYGRHWREPDEITKIAIGCLISVGGTGALALGAALTPAGDKISLGYALAFHIINSAGFANIFPVSIALYSRAAPKALAATVIGIYYLFLFLANTLVGIVGGWLETMPAASFWALHAGASLAAGLVFLAVKLLFGGLLAPTRADQ